MTITMELLFIVTNSLYLAAISITTRIDVHVNVGRSVINTELILIISEKTRTALARLYLGIVSVI
jgi:hypothetical protein